MARPSNADMLKRDLSRIKVAKQWRKDEGYDDLWRRLIDLYRGKHYNHMTEEDRLLVNISFSTVNVIAPSVAVNYPKITVNARKPDQAPQAIITEAVINYWWRTYKVRPQFRRAVKDFLVVGFGWLKCGYRFVEEEHVGLEDDISDENVQDADITPTTIITEDRPFVERVSPFDVFVDPDATSEEDMRWIAQRIRRPLKEVKADKRYSPTARAAASPTMWGHSITDSMQTPGREIQDRDEQYVEVWEFYDLVRGTMSVFCEASDHYLVKPFKMPYSFGHPFVMIRNYDVPDYFYPMGDLEALEPLQRELNETRSQMMNHRKRYARKYLFKAEAFDAEGRKALESDEDNTMVPVSEQTDSLNDVVAPFPTVTTPPEFYEQSALIQSDVDLVSGVSEYQRGGMPEIRRTATEAAIVQDASNARAADKLATIEQSIAAVGLRLVQLAQQYMDGEQVARVVGKDGQPLWVTFDKDYIAGEFDFEVEAGSTAPTNESFRRQMALQMVDAMAPFAAEGVVNMPKLAAHVLQFGFGIKNPESFLNPMPPMGAEVGPDGMPMAPEGMMPEGGGEAPPDGMSLPQDAIAPPGATPQDLSGIDPGVLAALSSRIGLSTPNL